MPPRICSLGSLATPVRCVALSGDRDQFAHHLRFLALGACYCSTLSSTGQRRLERVERIERARGTQRLARPAGGPGPRPVLGTVVPASRRRAIRPLPAAQNTWLGDRGRFVSILGLEYAFWRRLPWAARAPPTTTAIPSGALSRERYGRRTRSPRTLRLPSSIRAGCVPSCEGIRGTDPGRSADYEYRLPSADRPVSA
jgi:hypothetical protein